MVSLCASTPVAPGQYVYVTHDPNARGYSTCARLDSVVRAIGTTQTHLSNARATTQSRATVGDAAVTCCSSVLRGKMKVAELPPAFDLGLKDRASREPTQPLMLPGHNTYMKVTYADVRSTPGPQLSAPAGP